MTATAKQHTLESVEKEVPTSLIILPKLKLHNATLKVTGTNYLIVHDWSQKAKDMILNKQRKKASERTIRDPEEEFRSSLYIEDGKYVFPSIAFKSAAVSACTSVSGVTKVAARQAFHIPGK